MAGDGKSCLITRTLPAARKTASILQDLGFSPIILPAANLEPTNNLIDENGVQAFLITSSNAPRLAKLNEKILEVPVFAVGDATKEAALNAGFKNVVSAGGDASALAVLVADRLNPKNGALLHLRGLEIAGDVSGLLGACGFEVRATTIYETIENKEFGEKINQILHENSGYVLFHSPKGAQRFAKYVDYNNTYNWTAICISTAASIAIDEPSWKQVLIANKPNEEAMFSLLK